MSKNRFFITIPLVVITLLISHWAAEARGPHQDGYPSPPTQEVMTPTLAGQPYPDPEMTTPMPIGGEMNSLPPTEDLGQDSTFSTRMQADSGRGLLILWVGFLASFLVFLTSVVGSIILFTRRNES